VALDGTEITVSAPARGFLPSLRKIWSARSDGTPGMNVARRIFLAVIAKNEIRNRRRKFCADGTGHHREYWQPKRNTNKGWALRVMPLTNYGRWHESALLLLLGAVVILLLIGCATSANLLLAAPRDDAKTSPFAPLSARDAGNRARQMLTESLVLSIAGRIARISAAGLGSCGPGRRWPGKFAAGERSPGQRSVLIFAAGISLRNGILSA